MARENKARYVILGFLSHEPLSGYDIKKRIEGGVGNFYDLSYGQIYPELSRLEEQGLVTKEIQVNEGKPSRKLYSITALGREELKKWVGTAVEEEKVQYDILLKLFFGSLIGAEENIQNIKAFRKKSIAKLSLMEAYEKNLRSVLSESPDHLYYLLTVNFGQHIYKAYVDWADQAVKELTEKNEK